MARTRRSILASRLCGACVLFLGACRATAPYAGFELEGAGLIGLRDQHGWKNTEVPLIRFDVADHGVVTANLRRVSDYPLLSQSMRRRHERDDIVPTVNPGPIKRGYDAIEAPNPTRIVPKGPAVILGGVRPGD